MKKKYVVISIIVFIVCIISWIVYADRQNETVSQTLYNQQFITINGDNDKIHIDLKNKRYFTNSGKAATSKKTYGRSASPYRGAQNGLPIQGLATNATHQKVKNNDYILVYKISPSIGLPYSKLKIRYNHKYLPVSSYGYVKRTHKWYLYNRYSYQYHSEKQYNKDFNKMVKLIKGGAFDPD